MPVLRASRVEAYKAPREERGRIWELLFILGNLIVGSFYGFASKESADLIAIILMGGLHCGFGARVIKWKGRTKVLVGFAALSIAPFLPSMPAYTFVAKAGWLILAGASEIEDPCLFGERMEWSLSDG